jgi:hypothetical protein
LPARALPIGGAQPSLERADVLLQAPHHRLQGLDALGLAPEPSRSEAESERDQQAERPE